MQPLTLKDLGAASLEFDRMVASTPAIDVFCSSTDWALPAQRALMPVRTPWVWRGEHGFAAFMKGLHPEGFTYLQPLESMWLLGSPFVFDQSEAFTKDWVKLAVAQRDWQVMMLAGISVSEPWVRHLLRATSEHFKISMGPETVRVAANLQGELDGFLSRRSRNFRRNLQRALRRSTQAGVVFEPITDFTPGELEIAFERVMAIEARSWKGLMGAGANEFAMREFYRLMLPRLAKRQAIRLIVASLNGEDIGFILGGIRGHTYRGLQFSFDQEKSPSGLGNVLQWQAISQLCQEGIELYDLGTDIAYKRKWGSPYLQTHMLHMARG